MRDHDGKFIEPPLSVQNFRAKQPLMVIVERFASEILVGIVSKRYRRARQNILHALTQTGLFGLRRNQSCFDR
ncbi:MAG: hypothetical protein KGL35_28875 [Bradyrhizobium sp.]|nr:hypothetical protein [Bradyrhizobium sp.]MDE2472632.1 hypothetical protein [Bradyrhizobium sp.]